MQNYTQKGSIEMPSGYQPPKKQQFDGKGNLKQHVAYFVETCCNAGTNGDLLLKRFMQSLKENAFDLYTDLTHEPIDSYDQLEKEFLGRFYSTRRTITMLALCHTKKKNDETVLDYISQWRSLNLNSRDRLCEKSAIKMCIQGMHCGLQYILKGIQIKTFEELATHGRDMEIRVLANQKLGIHVAGQ